MTLTNAQPHIVSTGPVVVILDPEVAHRLAIIKRNIPRLADDVALKLARWDVEARRNRHYPLVDPIADELEGRRLESEYAHSEGAHR